MIQQSNSGNEEPDLYSSDQPQPKPDQQTNTQPEDAADEQQQSYGYEIINGQQTNQVILIKLKSEHELWYRGNILFTSSSTGNKGNEEDWRLVFLEGNDSVSSIRHLANYEKEMHYFVISREDPYNGRILMLNEDVYKQKFYINLQHLLSLNYAASECTITAHPTIKYLKILQLKSSPAPPLFITMQSSKDTTIVQKYLHANEHMYLPNARILAMGQKVACNWDTKNRLMKFTGPGFVFFQPKSQPRNIFTLRAQNFFYLNLSLILFIIALYIIEYMIS